MEAQVNPETAASCAFMLQHLDDQSRSPPQCIFMFLGYLPPLTVSERPKRDYERYKQPGFYQSRTAILRWLTAPRSLSELSALIRRPCACSHEERSGSIHEEGVDVFRSSGRPRPFNFLFEIFLDIIGPALIGAWRGECTFMRPRQLLREMQRAWPSTYSDILPRGPEQTVRGLLYWLKADWEVAFDTRLVLLAIRSIAHFTYSLTLPYIVTSRTFIYDGFIRPVEAACAKLQSYRRGIPHTAAHSQAITLLTTDLNILSEIGYTVADRPQRDEMTTFCAQQLLVTCNHGFEALYPLDPTDAPKLQPWQSYLALGVLVFQSFPELDTSCLAPTFVDMLKRPSRSGPWSLLQEVFGRLEIEYRCASPDCTRTLYFGDSHFQRCNGCRRVLYCSRACQKHAWTHAAVPHRQICSLIRHVCFVYKIPRKTYGKTSKIAPLNLDERKVDLLVQHFEARTRYELKTSRT
jgi:hypothetical protein